MTTEQDWIDAGVLAQKALLFGKTLIKVGNDSLSVLRQVEAYILENGGHLAFPPQVSFNETAAHFCPTKNDNPVFSEGDVIKMDVGVMINGAIGDNALTVDLSDDGKYADLVQASKNACLAATKMVKTGVKTGEVGQVIEEEINALGYTPVKNLGGHGLGENIIHTDPFMPNYANGDKTVLQEGMHIAIEPFATEGEGYIKEKGEATIFGVNVKPRVRSPNARLIVNKVGTLPFATHQFEDKMAYGFFKMALNEMKAKGYPPLVDENNGFVSQHEHSVIIKDQKSRITTLLDED